MPYKLEQSASGGFYVIGPSGRHSRRPLPRARALAQMRALYAAENKESARAPTAIPPHGPGGLLNTPGLGTGKPRKRKWGMRHKESRYTFSFKAAGPPGEKIAPGITRIHGNLCNVHGRFGPCDKGGAVDRRPKAPGFGPKKTDAELEAKKQQEIAAKRDAVAAQMTQNNVGVSKRGAAALDSLSNGGSVDDTTAKGLVDMGLAERGSDGRVRLTPEGRAMNSAISRGDYGASLDASSRGADRASKQRERAGQQAERENKKWQREQDRKKRQDEREADKKKRDEEHKKREEERAAKRGRSKPSEPSPAPETLAPAGPPKQRDVSIDKPKPPSDAAKRRAEADARRAAGEERRVLREAEREERSQRKLTDLSQRAQSGNKLSDTEWESLIVEGLAERKNNMLSLTPAGQQQAKRKPQPIRRPTPRTGGRDVRIAKEQSTFQVFKDATGRWRWLSRTTTAYKDRDQEILSRAALDRAVAHMRATGQYGPLRWWHVGLPNPLNADAPWGPGIDLGWCDFSTRVKNTLVESGTFISDQVAEDMARIAPDLEMSPGLFHPYGKQGPRDKIFNDMIIFERSTVPRPYARASNLFTGFSVTHKESRMDATEIARRFGALKAKGVRDADLVPFLAELERVEKSADDQGVAFKSSEAPEVLELANGTRGVIVDGRFVALKAAMPPAEMIESGMAEVADAATEVAADDAAAGEEEAATFVGDMTADELRGLFREVLQEMGGVLTEMDQKMAAMGYERRQKEAQDAQAVGTLTTQVKSLETQLKTAQANLAKLTDTAARPGGGFRPSLDGQEDASTLTAEQLEARRLKEAENAGGIPPTGDPMVDTFAKWVGANPPWAPQNGMAGPALPANPFDQNGHSN